MQIFVLSALFTVLLISFIGLSYQNLIDVDDVGDLDAFPTAEAKWPHYKVGCFVYSTKILI